MAHFTRIQMGAKVFLGQETSGKPVPLPPITTRLPATSL